MRLYEASSVLDMTSDLELTIFYRVYEEPPSNQRVVLGNKPGKATRHSIDAFDNF